MSSITQIAAEKANAIEQLTFDEELKTSQWLRAAPFETVFCVAVKARTATWKVEGLLPDGTIIPLACYRREECSSRIFQPEKNRYIKEEVMCGIPIRFVSTVPQPDSQLWVIFKS
jgi:hypothetical protein